MPNSVKGDATAILIMLGLLIVGGASMLLNGCTAAQRQVAKVAISDDPTAHVSGAYQEARADIHEAHLIVKAHMPDFPPEDVLLLDAAWGKAILVSERIEAILAAGTTPDPQATKVLLAQGESAYHDARNVLLRHQNEFSADEWGAIMRTDARIQALGQAAQLTQDATALRGMAENLAFVLKVAAGAAL